jgi:glutamine synthetase adenylyltransferase
MAKAEKLIDKILEQFSTIDKSEQRVSQNLNVKENHLVDQDMNQLSRIGTAFNSRNFEEVEKIAGVLYDKRKNAHTERDRNFLVELTKYYLDSLFELADKENLIERILGEVLNLSTFKPDFRIRNLKFKLYLMNKHIKETSSYE